METNPTSNSQKESDQDFNDSLNIPFKWVVGIHKPPTNRDPWSYGGRTKTSNHVLLREDVSVGRFKRRSGEALCYRNDGRYKPQIPEEATVINGRACYSRVTCKQCLDRAKLLAESSK